MDINTPLLLTFALVTLGETLIPGPTLALVFEARLSATKKQVGELIAGITAANAMWVLIAIFIVYAGNTLLNNSYFSIFTYIGTAYLIYLASQRILSSTILLITGIVDESSPASKKTNYFITGFMAHFINPLTIVYYISTFGVATIGQSLETKIGFGVIAVLSDLIAYFIIAYVTFGNIESFFKRPFFRLLAGCALFYLTVHVLTGPTKSELNLSITPLLMIIIVAGFLCAAILEAYNYVIFRKDKVNTILWKMAKLWSICFLIYAAFGAFYSTLSAIYGSLFSLSEVMEINIRVCSIVATILALALSFFKTYGEIEDQRSQKENTITDITDIPNDCWQASPFKAGIVSFMFLVAIFGLLWLTDFRIQ